jgi:ADP-heptose:LPS heptosyltransferase
MPFYCVEPIVRIPHLQFFSFQRGDARAELSGNRSPGAIHDVSGDSPEIVEAAADLMGIDLLITVDTMLAHLAGALGRRVWVLLPFAADWRWMLDRSDSPWYPTMRLFRQPRPGDWASPVRQIVRALRSEAGALFR